MLNNSFVSNIYVGSDGKLHKVQGGADSVLPFSSGDYYLLFAASVNSSYTGGTYTVSKDVYPSKLLATSSTTQSQADKTITKEQYDASSSSNKITISNYGNQTAYLYKVNDTSFKIEASNMSLIVILGSSRG